MAALRPVWKCLAALALACLLGIAVPAQPVSAQDCLQVLVVDPDGAPITNATVVAGATEQPTDDSGVATLCGLGPGPTSVIALAPDFQPQEREISQASGEVRFQLAIASVTERIVVVGSRSDGRTVLESAVPVDILPSEEFTQQGDPDVANQLRNTVPSFNVNVAPISDAGTIVRPASLRNLAPDHTLLLVNGKRRHRAAVIHWFTVAVSDGAQGPDLSVIPSIALRQAEVLRDGASAQYGSDAIAGVLNFRLKDAASGGSVQVSSGRYAAGDGRTTTYAGNVGLPLGKRGFANLSIEYGNSEPTSRSVQREEALQHIANGNTAVPMPTAQIWGNPDIDHNVKFFGNFGRFVGNSTEIYGHTNYASRTVDGSFYWRNPHRRAALYSGDGGDTLLVGDLLDAKDGVLDGSAGCPTVPVAGGKVLDQAAFDTVMSDPNCFTFHKPFAGNPNGFPGGFTPRFGGDYRDSSIVGGVRGRLAPKLSWDASLAHGSSEIDFFIYNTVNASLGPDSPSSFRPGTATQDETNVNFDLSYVLSDQVLVAAGTEWRNETFTSGLGGEPSWSIGPLAAQGFSSGSNGFPGYGPLAVGSWSRSNYAVYGDIELGGADRRYALGAALRAERFSDFGPTRNYKAVGRYQLTGLLAVRGAASTGFRAPTPGQQNSYAITVALDPGTNEVINQGTIPSGSDVARFVGGEPLGPEKSRNYTAGAILERGQFSFTADYFRIDLADRLWFSRLYTLTRPQVDQLVAEGVVDAGNIAKFRFFTNDFDTVSQGVDLVATYAPAALNGNTVISFLLNHTNTSVADYNPETVTPARINLLENSLPESRWNVTLRHKQGRFRFTARLSYWGDFFDREDNYGYPGEYIADLEATFDLTRQVSLSGGGQNLFNNYPATNPFAAQRLGNPYPQSTPFGFNGGYYYMRLNYVWRGLP